MKRFVLGLAVVLGGAASNLSCDVNDYCLNCLQPGDGGPGDAVDAPVDAGDGGFDADDAGPCIPTGLEVCDGEDNDCDGQIDEGQLPTVGDSCSSPPALNSGLGECAGGVKQCVAGAIVCSKPPMPELCDNLDNNCNGIIDDGDPGGGAQCGTNVGECSAGVNRCVDGQVICVGAIGPAPDELCNNRDDDCDGMFDEGLTNLGACVPGVDGPAQGDTGECVLGARACVGGVIVCQGAVFPSFELCDGLDQDCDGNPTNGYDLGSDPQNCGGCGMVCNLPHAFEGCANGTCTIVACETGWHDNNGIAADGCEFGPCMITGNEVCDGIDNDCDGLVDADDPDLVAPTGLCNNVGACSTMTTLTCNGAQGWKCNYGNPHVSLDGNGNIVPETLCDSDIVAGVFADNDCDGRIDEGQPNLGDACDNGELGECRSSGTYGCDPANRNGPATCSYTEVGGTPSPEICDGLDNDCNGTIDDGASTGDLPGQDWITIPNTSPAVQMMKYEASRPDSLGDNSIETHVCSAADRMPWTNITYPQAEAACASIGARLCTEAEWQQMCTPEPIYPVTGPATTATTDFVFIEAEDAFANTTIGGADRAWKRITPPDENGITAMQVPDLGFSVQNAANALSQSSRLDFRLNLQGSTQYRVWLRAKAASSTRVHTPPSNSLSAVSHAGTEVGDLVIVTTWTASSNNIPTHTLQPGFTQIRSHSLNSGNNDGRLSIAYKIATAAGAQSYQAYTVSGGSSTRSFTGLAVFRGGTIDVANIVSASASHTNGQRLPDPPSVGNLTSRAVVLAIGAWHVSSATTINVGPPGSYTEMWELSGSHAGELSMAQRVLSAGATGNPGSFSDNVSPNATVSATIALPLSASDSVWTGLTAGTSAGPANSGDVSVPASNQWRWVVSPALTSGPAGLHTFSLYTREDGLMIDKIAISRQSTASPTFDNSWAYETNPRTAQPQTCNGHEYDTDPSLPGDQDGILPTGSLASCHANKGPEDAYDMSGNVKEWTAARAGGQNPIRGGASNNLVTGLTCDLNFTLADDTFFFPNVGFRCCR